MYPWWFILLGLAFIIIDLGCCYGLGKTFWRRDV
jgi:hypothetical protein